MKPCTVSFSCILTMLLLTPIIVLLSTIAVHADTPLLPPHTGVAGLSSTAALTSTLVTEINVSELATQSAVLQQLMADGSLLYFQTYGPSGTELWRSDGTATGTHFVATVSPQKNVSLFVQGATTLDNTTFFPLDDGSYGFELWKTDGTITGTLLLKDINPGAGASYPNEFTKVGSTIFFRVNDENGRGGLWKSDGTTAGTVLVKDRDTNGLSLHPYDLTAVQDNLFFTTNGGLWVSDGTDEGTQMLKAIEPFMLTNVNGVLYFVIITDSTRELWKSDGTIAGTVQVKVFLPTSPISRLTAFNGLLFFGADEGSNGLELWRSDGTEAGTWLVKDINPGAANADPIYLTAVADSLFFFANDGLHGYELWRSDGTEGGTVMVTDLNPGSGSLVPDLANELQPAVANDTLFFWAANAQAGKGLWRSNGGESGTQLVKAVEYFGGHLIAVGDTLFWASGDTLWKSDGSSAALCCQRFNRPEALAQ